MENATSLCFARNTIFIPILIVREKTAFHLIESTIPWKKFSRFVKLYALLLAAQFSSPPTDRIPCRTNNFAK